MKKFILSLVVLSIIIISGILSITYFKSSSGRLVDILEKSSHMVVQGNWIEAKNKMEDMEKEWDDTEKTWSLLTDHIEIDSIEMSMKKLKEYINTSNTSLALAEMESLKFMVEHTFRKEQFNIKNIF